MFEKASVQLISLYLERPNAFALCQTARTQSSTAEMITDWFIFALSNTLCASALLVFVL